MVGEDVNEINEVSLLKRIEKMRRKLVNDAFRDGFTAPSTIKQSELLDEQIETYQKMIKNM
ncbi:aspartyl-phosphate phosphatase Spo0E family protein [Gracilibacillus sp. S3-1-1]|uniref:Aspartyl-phosphate phosphatase Spo0E family protein n=1 Tax=Gracilibacillus pellucidus TaxID=3095368 RepID=A0ACC6M8F0_9BACI|nr:aspartyl-phosphate phosphatase Spo0E family protein [Gracilibacillus sp. S3-1-1]MDX8047168.1 aspartyl-phosphate phosphatase Spo0E family protein [Gracilibacillus sp. S3-1-1]